MARLIARTPGHGLLPVAVGALTLREVEHGAITSLMPLKGQQEQVSGALKEALGLEFPEPGQSAQADGVLMVWTGAGQAMVLGAAVAPEGAAVTDQSDAWACLTLMGSGARDVLARLVPIDLRASAFGPDRAARTLLGHMSCILFCTREDVFEIMVFRSMARTAVHELERVMISVTAQR